MSLTTHQVTVTIAGSGWKAIKCSKTCSSILWWCRHPMWRSRARWKRAITYILIYRNKNSSMWNTILHLVPVHVYTIAVHTQYPLCHYNNMIWYSITIIITLSRFTDSHRLTLPGKIYFCSRHSPIHIMSITRVRFHQQVACVNTISPMMTVISYYSASKYTDLAVFLLNSDPHVFAYAGTKTGTSDLRSWPRPLYCVRACVRLLFLSQSSMCHYHIIRGRLLVGV